MRQPAGNSTETVPQALVVIYISVEVCKLVRCVNITTHDVNNVAVNGLRNVRRCIVLRLKEEEARLLLDVRRSRCVTALASRYMTTSKRNKCVRSNIMPVVVHKTQL